MKNKEKLYIAIIIILLIVIGSLYLEKENKKWDLILYRSIPHISLSNTLNTQGNNPFYFGSIKGFVVFNKESDQPKNANQYYIIEPLPKLNDEMNQIFALEEILTLYPLPPETISHSELKTIYISDSTIALEDESGNMFFIDKSSKQVTTKDATGDTTRLITNNSEYSDFMEEFLKKQY